MMLGTCAQPLHRGGSSGPNLLASADFVNGTYSVGGSTVTAADVVSDTGRISASGLSIMAGGPVQLLGGFLSTLLPANFTVVAEFEAETPEWAGHRLFLLSLFDPGGNEASVYTSFLFGVAFDSNAAEALGSRTAFDEYGGTAGINKIAMTRTDDRLAVAMNGNPAAVEFGSLPAAAYNTARIADHNGTGDTNGISGFVRKMDVYAPVADAALPALTA